MKICCSNGKCKSGSRQTMEEGISREKKEPFIPDSGIYQWGGRAYALDHAAGSCADYNCEHTGCRIQ